MVKNSTLIALAILFVFGLVKLTDFQHPLVKKNSNPDQITESQPREANRESFSGEPSTKHENDPRHGQAPEDQLNPPGSIQQTSERSLAKSQALAGGLDPAETIDSEGTRTSREQAIVISDPNALYVAVSGYMIEGVAPRLIKWKNLTPKERNQQLAALEQAGGSLYPLEAIATTANNRLWMENGQRLDQPEPSQKLAASEHDTNGLDQEWIERPGYEGTRIYLTFQSDESGRFESCTIVPQQWPLTTHAPIEIQVEDKRSAILRLGNPRGDSLVLLSFDFVSREALAQMN